MFCHLAQVRGGGCGATRWRRPASFSRRETLFLEHDLFEKPDSTFSDHAHLSGEIGIWISPLMCLIGPAADGKTSKSKISVGNHSVAQALGTSTTPEMWPWHGAVPRIE